MADSMAIGHIQQGGQTWVLLMDVCTYLLSVADKFPDHKEAQRALRESALYLSEMMLDASPPTQRDSS